MQVFKVVENCKTVTENETIPDAAIHCLGDPSDWITHTSACPYFLSIPSCITNMETCHLGHSRVNETAVALFGWLAVGEVTIWTAVRDRGLYKGHACDDVSWAYKRQEYHRQGFLAEFWYVAWIFEDSYLSFYRKITICQENIGKEMVFCCCKF